MAVHQVHFYGEDGFPYVRAAAIDDDDDVVVGVLSAFTPGAGTEEHDLPNTGAEPFAHQPREFGGYSIRTAMPFHRGMLARTPTGPADPSSPDTTGAPRDDGATRSE